jgi:hypothetical protein
MIPVRPFSIQYPEIPQFSRRLERGSGPGQFRLQRRLWATFSREKALPHPALIIFFNNIN